MKNYVVIKPCPKTCDGKDRAGFVVVTSHKDAAEIEHPDGRLERMGQITSFENCNPPLEKLNPSGSGMTG